MINSKDLTTLLSLLSEGDEKPFEAIATTFYRTFSKNDHFKVGCAIYTMIKDGFIKIQTHRLIGFYILFSLYKPEASISSSGSLSSSSILTTTNINDEKSSTSTPSNSTSSPSSNNSNIASHSATSSSSSNSIPSSSSEESILDYPIIFNPFLPIFIDEIEKQFNLEESLTSSSSTFNPIEKHILSLFLTNLPKDFSKKTPKEIINITKATLLSPTTNSINNNIITTTTFTKSILKEYKNFYLERLVNHCYPSFRSIGVSPNLLPNKTLITENNIISNNNNINTTPSSSSSSSNITNNNSTTSPSTNNINNNNLKDIEVNNDQLSFFSFEPQYKRVTPPIFSPVTTIWINSSINHGLILSNPPTLPSTSSTTPNLGSKKIIRDLMTKAIKCRLKKQQLTQIKQEMDLDPKLVLYSGLTPKKLPNLVENNTSVAIDALLKLIHSPDFKDYFQTLITMEMNFRSMEVVNALANSVELPNHFIPMYITNCINTCNNIKDKAMQQRSVRLVCVFIQSLIKNKIIDIKDLFTEVQSFCLEFSKIREAINLFKFINESSF